MHGGALEIGIQAGDLGKISDVGGMLWHGMGGSAEGIGRRGALSNYANVFKFIPGLLHSYFCLIGGWLANGIKQLKITNDS